jgi:hypothetical protein
MRAVAALATLVLACAPSYTPIPGGANAPRDGGTGFIRFPGGFSQSTGERAFIEVDGLGVDAVDLDDGDVAFRDEQADRILGAAHGRLVVRDRGGAGIGIGVLDAATGDRVAPSQRIDLPGCPSVDLPTPEPGALLFRWQGMPCVGGAAPDPSLFENIEFGGLRVDLQRGAVTRAAAPEERSSAEQLPLPAGAHLAEYWTGSTWRNDPIAIDGERVVLLQQGGARLLYWLDASGAPLREHRLSSGPGFVQRTSDERYLTIRGAEEADLVSLVDGTVAARIRLKSTSSITRYFTVVRGLFFYGRSLQGQNGEDFTVVAVDATGREIWTRDVIGQHTPPPP